MRDFVTAWEFLTRIRLSRRSEWREEDFGHSLGYFPLVALIAGLILAGVNFLLLRLGFSDLLRSVMLLVTELFCVGGLMYDGYMDTCDGVFSARDRQRMLEIMKDSHVGANGVLGMGVLLLLKFSLYVSVAGEVLSVLLVLAWVVTRALMVFFIVVYPYPRSNGIGKMFKDYAHNWALPVAGMVVLGICWHFGWFYLAVALLTFVIMNGFAVFLNSQLGGLTGDTYGFLTEVGFVVYFLVYIMGSRCL